MRYYGYYSSAQRGRRRLQGREKMACQPLPTVDEAPHAKAARATWARFNLYRAAVAVCRIAAHSTDLPAFGGGSTGS